MRIGGHDIAERVLYVAELGINHNGDMEAALRLICEAANHGADAVKFQVGNPDRYVTASQRTKWRQMPDGEIWSYLRYRRSVELDPAFLRAAKYLANERGLLWFASPLDVSAVETCEALDVPCYKIASPMVTDHDLLDAVAATGRPVLLSSGATTDAELDAATTRFRWDRLAILHAVSRYPCPDDACNVLRIPELRRLYGLPIGYSGHEKGLPPSLAAVALGARIVERHFTLDRAMWGSDHGASLEPEAFRQLVRYGRTIESALGTGDNVISPEELRAVAKFRKIPPSADPVSAQ